MAAARSYAAVLCIRFFLGFVEAPFFPGALLVLTSWYARDELPLRIAILYAGNTLSNCFGGLIAAGVIGGMDDALGIKSWRWLFIIEGCFTIAMAFVAYFVLPNYPGDAKWITEEERAFARWRIAREAAGQADGEDEKSVWQGGFEALRDPKLYMLILIQVSLLVGMSYVSFIACSGLLKTNPRSRRTSSRVLLKLWVIAT
jgi:MFS family permease